MRLFNRTQTVKTLTLTASLAMLAACSTAPAGSEFNDPYEAHNREVHAGNKSLDTHVVRPVSQGYGTAVPEPVRKGVSNFADNLDLPRMVVNDLLQLKLEDAFVNSGRFLFNSTIGLAGVFDPASSIDLYARDTDFGETLHVWGVGEGAYLEVPVLGPSTERDLVGTVVDFAMNPTRVLATGDLSAANTAADIGAQVGDRYEYSDLVDEVLYESADSYAQARLLYLQNRRFELNAGEEPEYLDPYEDLYAE